MYSTLFDNLKHQRFGNSPRSVTLILKKQNVENNLDFSFFFNFLQKVFVNLYKSAKKLISNSCTHYFFFFLTEHWTWILGSVFPKKYRTFFIRFSKTEHFSIILKNRTFFSDRKFFYYIFKKNEHFHFDSQKTKHFSIIFSKKTNFFTSILKRPNIFLLYFQKKRTFSLRFSKDQTFFYYIFKKTEHFHFDQTFFYYIFKKPNIFTSILKRFSKKRTFPLQFSKDRTYFDYIFKKTNIFTWILNKAEHLSIIFLKTEHFSGNTEHFSMYLQKSEHYLFIFTNNGPLEYQKKTEKKPNIFENLNLESCKKKKQYVRIFFRNISHFPPHKKIFKERWGVYPCLWKKPKYSFPFQKIVIFVEISILKLFKNRFETLF